MPIQLVCALGKPDHVGLAISIKVRHPDLTATCEVIVNEVLAKLQVGSGRDQGENEKQQRQAQHRDIFARPHSSVGSLA